jgi:hypothetical protein
VYYAAVLDDLEPEAVPFGFVQTVVPIGWAAAAERERRRTKARRCTGPNLGEMLQDISEQGGQIALCINGFAPEKVGTSTHIRFVGRGSF